MDSQTIKDQPSMPSGAIGRRIFGVPIQFAIVVVVSSALTIFFGAWAADARVEARSQPFAVSGAHLQAPGGYPDTTPSGLSSTGEPLTESEKETWEASFLFLCPLH
ncbi:MAG: hypothetical protein QGG34_05425 [SAR202 cluster bacterium]|nr:hypothetical protein [SAR202 cluster bacterium]MDP6299990.1 hypothetical protein [SAR202 cluster bacterium]MDP7102801.1 hypothetical protein [SAR202 cluster bacterium]MDP7224282.1 hypothetical protein [SAR202 cluster bacterium]MDP7413486.1 hypothetical protein [SAR202 cluster bacterium]